MAHHWGQRDLWPRAGHSPTASRKQRAFLGTCWPAGFRIWPGWMFLRNFGAFFSTVDFTFFTVFLGETTQWKGGTEPRWLQTIWVPWITVECFWVLNTVFPSDKGNCVSLPLPNILCSVEAGVSVDQQTAVQSLETLWAHRIIESDILQRKAKQFIHMCMRRCIYIYIRVIYCDCIRPLVAWRNQCAVQSLVSRFAGKSWKNHGEHPQKWTTLKSTKLKCPYLLVKIC